MNKIIRFTFLLGLICPPFVHNASALSMKQFPDRHIDITEFGDEGGRGGALKRDEFFSRAATSLMFPLLMITTPEVAHGAAPVTSKDTDSLALIAKRKLRQKPPKVLRRKLSRDFAILLMRSSYNALDDLDCVPMFLIRSSEYGPYLSDLGPGMVQQGDLSDPFYFDFISYAQYATINREITEDPPSVFEENQAIDEGEGKPMNFVDVVVKRDPSLTNAMLGPEHSRIVGSVILDRLDEIFGQTDSAIPFIEKGSKPEPTDASLSPLTELLLAALQQLVNLFLVNGYAFGGNASLTAEGTNPWSAKGASFLISLNAPATLWGGKILQKEGAIISNSFVTKAATELIRRSGYEVASSIKYDGTTENISINIL
eukprot:scaffold7340_cov128-Cylindrotheca_fusiformis.AAC.1